jgi:hypothetical protein
MELNGLEAEAARRNALEASAVVSAEIQRRVVERSDQLRSCQPALRETEVVDVIVEVGGDGTTSAKIVGTSVSECAVVSCIRKGVTGLQIVLPKAETSHEFRWLVAIDPAGPVRFEASDPTTKWFGQSPQASAACLDSPEASKTSGRLPPEDIRRVVRGNYRVFRECYEGGLGRHSDLTGRVRHRTRW